MRVEAPWTDEQVASLKRWQVGTYYHPFTCINRIDHPYDPEGDFGVLVPSNNGWTCRHCDYTQNWSYDFMLKLPA